MKRSVESERNDSEVRSKKAREETKEHDEKNNQNGFKVIVSPVNGDSEPLDKDAVAGVIRRLLNCTVLSVERQALPAMTAMFVRSSSLKKSEDAAVCVTVAEEEAAVRAGDLDFKLEEVLGQPVSITAPKKRLTAEEKLAAVEKDAEEGAASIGDVVEQRKRVERKRFTENFIRTIDEGEKKKADKHQVGSSFNPNGAKTEAGEAQFRPKCSVVMLGCPPRMDSIKGASKVFYEEIVKKAQSLSKSSDSNKAFYRRMLFAKHSTDIVKQVIVRKDTSGAFKGTLFVEFVDEETTSFVLNNMTRPVIDGKKLSIRPFDPSMNQITAAPDKPALTPSINISKP